MLDFMVNAFYFLLGTIFTLAAASIIILAVAYLIVAVWCFVTRDRK